MDLIVIGGGIGGLATAHAFRREARAAGRTIRITVLEAQGRWGGLIDTERRDGFLLEHGPDALLTSTSAATDLLGELGLTGQLQGVESDAGPVCIVRGRHPLPLPAGLTPMGPARLRPFLTSPLVSVRCKLRMLTEWFIAARPGSDDESLAAFVRRRLGNEAFDRLFQPLVGAIHGGNLEHTSLQAVLPQLAAMEREHGGILRGLRARAGSIEARSAGPRYGLFATLRDGLGSMVRALVAELRGCDLRLYAQVRSLHRSDGYWHLRLADGSALSGHHVVLALPAPVAGKLIRPVSAELADGLQAIAYRNVATAQLAIPLDRLRRQPAMVGFLTAAIEQRTVLAATCASRKFAGRAPANSLLLRVGLPSQTAYRDEAEVLKGVTPDLAEIIGARSDIRVLGYRHWTAALPEYRVGHAALVQRIRGCAAAIRGLSLVGNAYAGTGVANVIDSANQAALPP